MAKVTVTRTYSGKSKEPVPWEAIVRIIDAIWGPGSELGGYPKRVGGMHGRWQDVDGREHIAASLEEIEQAYLRHETVSISFSGGIRRSVLVYIPGQAVAHIEVRAEDDSTVDQMLAAVRQEFPYPAKYVFISYHGTEDLQIAYLLQELLASRVDPGIIVFVAKRDIDPGDPWLKEIQEQLENAEVLIAICSPRSVDSAWISWESGTVWARGKRVVPLFVGIRPSDFDGPIAAFTQGGQLSDENDLNRALQAVVSDVSPKVEYQALTPDEVARLRGLLGK